MNYTDRNDLSLDLLLQETLVLSEHLRSKASVKNGHGDHIQTSFLSKFDDIDYLPDLVDDMIENNSTIPELKSQEEEVELFPESPGIIYKTDNGTSTFCIRGYPVENIKNAMLDLLNLDSCKRSILKLQTVDVFGEVSFFETKTLELAEAIKEQVINRRFPHLEDAVCNISDPGFSWWMDITNSRFEIFFRSHGINRAEKYIQLGPIGDGSIAALRMNQAKRLIRSSFPLSEFSCDDKSFTVASSKPDHLSFISFRNIFLEGINNTALENFPDNSVGRSLFYYFHELAIVRKFWIEVKAKLG